jgi:curved DNA-binding protein CbpA
MARQQVSKFLYEHLGLKDFATPEEIRKAYKTKALAHHPDREGGDTEAMKKVNAAYDILTKHKDEYDQLLRIHKYNQPPPVQTIIINFGGSYGNSYGSTWTTSTGGY